MWHNLRDGSHDNYVDFYRTDLHRRVQKNVFECPETNPVTLFWFLFYPKNKRKIPKMMPDDPKNGA